MAWWCDAGGRGDALVCFGVRGRVYAGELERQLYPVESGPRRWVRVPRLRRTCLAERGIAK